MRFYQPCFFLPGLFFRLLHLLLKNGKPPFGGRPDGRTSPALLSPPVVPVPPQVHATPRCDRTAHHFRPCISTWERNTWRDDFASEVLNLPSSQEIPGQLHSATCFVLYLHGLAPSRMLGSDPVAQWSSPKSPRSISSTQHRNLRLRVQGRNGFPPFSGRWRNLPLSSLASTVIL